MSDEMMNPYIDRTEVSLNGTPYVMSEIAWFSRFEEKTKVRGTLYLTYYYLIISRFDEVEPVMIPYDSKQERDNDYWRLKECKGETFWRDK